MTFTAAVSPGALLRLFLYWAQCTIFLAVQKKKRLLLLYKIEASYLGVAYIYSDEHILHKISTDRAIS